MLENPLKRGHSCDIFLGHVVYLLLQVAMVSFECQYTIGWNGEEWAS